MEMDQRMRAMWLIHRGHMLLKLKRISEAKANLEQAQAMLKVDGRFCYDLNNKNPDELIVIEYMQKSNWWIQLCEDLMGSPIYEEEIKYNLSTQNMLLGAAVIVAASIAAVIIHRKQSQ